MGGGSSARPELRQRSAARQPRTLASAAPVAAVNIEIPAPFAEPVARDNESRAVESFADLLALAAEKRDLTMKSALERDVRWSASRRARSSSRWSQAAQDPGPGAIEELADWTGRRWMVAVPPEAGQPSLRARRTPAKSELKDVVPGPTIR